MAAMLTTMVCITACSDKMNQIRMLKITIQRKVSNYQMVLQFPKIKFMIRQK